MSELTVLVLAAGKGTRFFPLTTDKILFPFFGKPLASYTVERLIPNTATRVVVVANDSNVSYFRQVQFGIPSVVVTQEGEGMAGAVLSAANEIGNGSLLILIADDLFEPTLIAKVLEEAENSKANVVLPGWKTRGYFPGGYLRLNGNAIVEIVEKPQPGSEPSDYVNISGHFIRHASSLIQTLRDTESTALDRYEQAVSAVCAQEGGVYVPYEGAFMSLKYPWHVLDLMDMLLETVEAYRGENVQVKEYVTLEGPIHIGNNVKIMEYTKIVGPVFIGDNTIIGNNNVIRHSSIGADCVTGFNTDITRSYIGNSCWFHSNYLGDSVLEENISMGSGTVLANLRLDEGDIHSVVKEARTNTTRNKLGAIIGRDVRIGVNSSTMPGVKIGSGSMIGAGILLPHDIPSGSFVAGKTVLTIQPNRNTSLASREALKQKL